MAKRKSFEEIFNTELRWPRQGDKPFVVSDDPFDNANIATKGLARIVLMKDGYKVAADLMARAAQDDRPTRDILVFPIIFNYRHFLELTLKYQIARYGPPVGIKQNWHTHYLDPLWASFLDMLGRYGTQDPDEADPIVGEIIVEFAKIDPGSYSYRYPVDRQGNPVPVTHNDLHLPTLTDVMHAVDGYFTGCDGYLGDLSNPES